MLKKANKITSLLVTASAVMSLVPAYASDVKRIEAEDGTVYNAVAYKDGKAYVDGEINDEEGAYYVSNGKFSELDDVDSGDDANLYGEKYLDINDGDYTVDLSDGSVSDDDIKSDTDDDAASALRKKIKKDTDDRYNEDDADSIKDSDDDDFNVIPGNKYGKLWYAAEYKAADRAINDGVNGLTAGGIFNVFTDENGNYIDADYNIGKIKVTTTASSASTKSETINKSETIKNTNDTYDAAGDKGSDALTASVKQDKVLTQDDDYIYRLATISVNVTTASGATISKINDVSLKDLNSETFTIANDGKNVSFKAIQKISKAADSDDIDGADYAKTVTTYALSDDDGDKLDGFDLFDDNDNIKYTVAGGKLIAYKLDLDEHEVTTQAFTLKSSGGYYYTDPEDDSTEDFEESDDDDNDVDDVQAVTTDVDGNLWRIDGGYIYKFDNTDDWDKVYKVDGSMNHISVYDEDNIVAWSDDDDEVYSLIGSNSSDSDDDTNTDDTNTDTITTGWVQAADGTWYYNKADGTKATGWLQDGYTWYYLNDLGVMSTGWANVNGTWYYLNGSGAMQTGWLNVNGTWYYLNGSGAMQTGWLNDNGTWYYLNGSGAMQTGWLNDNGTWYYLNGSGAMLANTTVNGYTLGSNGAWIR